MINKYVQEAEYLEIIVGLLSNEYGINSLAKIVFMTFCIKHERRKSYGTRRMDFVDALLDNLNVKLLSHPEELETIFGCLHKLKISGWISIDEDMITVKRSLDDIPHNNVFLKANKGKVMNPIGEINKLDSKAFIEEVLRHV